MDGGSAISRPVAIRPRLAAAIAIGVAAAAFNWWTKARLDKATDLEQVLVAARAMWHGVDPYSVVGPGLTYHWPWQLLYPLPAVVLALPFSSPRLPFGAGAALFTGIGAALVAYALTHDGWHRLQTLLSAPALWAFWWAQWSPALTAAAVLPWLGFMYAAKPTIGLALLAYRPSRKALIGAGLLVVLSIALHPQWPAEWIRAVRASDRQHFFVPALWPGGALALFALLRWRRPEARLLAVLACVPQSPTFYDMLPLALVPATPVQSLLFVGLTHAAALWAFAHWHFVSSNEYLAGYLRVSGPASIVLVYLPCLVMVLRRPNEGRAPRWMERVARRFMRRGLSNALPNG